MTVIVMVTSLADIDRDCDGDLLADNGPLSTLWKTFVQIYKDEEKCLKHNSLLH